MQIQYAINSYRARAPDLSAQRLVNYFAEAAPADAKDRVVVYGAPGLKEFAASVGNGPIRGKHVMASVEYAVSGDTFYSVSALGVATDLGTLSNLSTPVSMAHNQATTQQLIIVDGTTDGWIYDTTNGLVKITDVDFLGGVQVVFIDGYFALVKPDSRQWYLSNLNDGTAYLGTDIATAEGAANELVAITVNHREVWLFKAGKGTEIWFNTGAADFPFERNSSVFIERGCAAAFSVAREDNTIFWLGDDRVAYRAEGYTPTRVSTHAIEEAWRKYAVVSDAIAFFITLSGHKFYILTFPNANATWVYDINTGMWHERESFGIGRWRAQWHTEVYGKHLVGDYADGKIGELDLDTFAEYGTTMQGIAVGPSAYSNKKWIFFNMFELDIEAGTGLTSGTGSDPQIWLDWSNDGGHTWSARKLFRSMGKIGERRTRLRWRKLGRDRQRVFRVTTSDPVKRSLVVAHLEAEEGES